MIRWSSPTDADGIMDVAAASGLFEGDQLDVLKETLTRSFDGRSERPELWFTDCEGERVVGVAYCASELMTEGTWNLLFIAVHPDFKGRGRGKAILSHVETALGELSGRMLIIETSSGDDFEDTRAFYAKLGYDQEGTIRDFYADGADKIVFRKLLAGG